MTLFKVIFKVSLIKYFFCKTILAPPIITNVPFPQIPSSFPSSFPESDDHCHRESKWQTKHVDDDIVKDDKGDDGDER